MKQKTAMMELIEVLEDFVKELDEKYSGDPWVKRGVYIAINEAKNKLEKEKEQIIEADLAGVERTVKKVNEFIPMTDILKTIRDIKDGLDEHNEGEHCYNKTYKQD